MVTRTKRLSAAKVAQVREPGKYYDDHGLFLRVEPAGSKRWVQRLTIGGKQRELGLGSALLVSLAEAREMALENRKLARSGGDPLKVKKVKAAIPTFDEALEKVYALHAPTWRNPKHAAQFLSTLKTYVSPQIGAKPVSDVSSADVLAVLTPIWSTKAETARRVKQRIGTVMKWAVAQGFRADDPTLTIAQALPKAKVEAVHRKSLPFDQVADCLEGIRGSDAMTSTKLALELLVLTAARSGEVRLATWSEINFETSVWSIPGERMKGKVEHIVPLSLRATEVLLEARQQTSGELVFPGIKPGRPISDMTMSKLVKELGFETDVHGFRTSFRVWVQERTNTPFEVAEKALAHKTRNKVVAAYARSDLFEKRRLLMERWADYLSEEHGKVVQIGGLD